MEDGTVKEASPAEASSVVAGPVEETVANDQIIQYFKDHDSLVIKLSKKFEEIMNDLEFLVDESWVERAIRGFNKPDLNERLESQFYTNARKVLRDKAADDEERTGQYVPPTKEEIQALVDKRIEDRRREIQKKKDRKVAKASAAIKAGKQ